MIELNETELRIIDETLKRIENIVKDNKSAYKKTINMTARIRLQIKKAKRRKQWQTEKTQKQSCQ